MIVNLALLAELSQSLVGEGGVHVDYPELPVIMDVLDKIKAVLFPRQFISLTEFETHQAKIQTYLAEIHTKLSNEIKTAFLTQDFIEDVSALAEEKAAGLLENLPEIQQALLKDAQAGFEGDPAARTVDEIILTYPGFFAVFVYRIANFLYKQDVPLLPRMMTEYAHNITGIDIHPGATIGEYFFVDHGTGIVIGETTVIGNRVKLYQGVTLGALSTKSGQRLAGKKRHPTIEDNVIIYSGASILGGDTIIGEGAVIGGNAFIVRSVPARTIVRMLNQEVQYNDGSGMQSHAFEQPDAWFYEI